MATERERALARARAEQERRKRQQSSQEDESRGAFREGLDTVGRFAGDINRGMLDPILPDAAMDRLQSWGVVSPEREGLVPAGGRMLGESALWTAGGLAGLKARAVAGGRNLLSAPTAASGAAGAGGGSRLAQGGRDLGQAVGRAADDALLFHQRNPGTFWAAETGAGFGAGVGQEAVSREADLMGAEGPGRDAAEMGGLLLGGLAGGGVTQLPGALRRGTRRVTDELLPWGRQASERRAAKTLQKDVVEPRIQGDRRQNILEETAMRAESAPEGVTPARATDQRRALAREARIREDNPQIEQEITDSLGAARERMRGDLQGMFGQPRTRDAWAADTVNRVTAPGYEGTIQRGDTDTMLRQARQTFNASYSELPHGEIDPTGLGREFGRTINNPDINIDSNVRSRVRSWFNNQLKQIAKRRRRDGTEQPIGTEDMLDVREKLRRRQREIRNVETNEAVGERRILRDLENQLTEATEAGLPGDAADQLRAIDGRYRQFMTVEDAAFRTGDDTLSPEALQRSIYGRAQNRADLVEGSPRSPDDQALRQQALQGRGVSEVLDSPEQARRMVRGLSAEERGPVKADYVNNITRRATRVDPDTGAEYLDVQRLRQQLTETDDVARALGVTGDEKRRLNDMIDQLAIAQRPDESPANVVLEDGLSAGMELVGRYLGAQAGQRVAGGGLGSSLVLAQHMSGRAVRALSRFTRGHAEKLMADAMQDPQLYAALLRKDVGSNPRAARESAQQLQGWLLANVADETTDFADEQMERIPPVSGDPLTQLLQQQQPTPPQSQPQQPAAQGLLQ